MSGQGNVCSGCFEIIASNATKLINTTTGEVWHRRCYSTAGRVRGFLEGKPVHFMQGVPSLDAEGGPDAP